ncbi:hypothetical protein DPMN_125276 [Dreissena polymorpha]|uniref:Uncharacterized protein n=1 Tax=Dreissena polymorpha TaxID=45954 RepID=A0A9D4H141_DREPO|nr:hypothetical protein DPMN_125276 [Dreissena polymorpha]
MVTHSHVLTELPQLLHNLVKVVTLCTATSRFGVKLSRPVNRVEVILCTSTTTQSSNS